jgi:hypothetical protein
MKIQMLFPVLISLCMSFYSTSQNDPSNTLSVPIQNFKVTDMYVLSGVFEQNSTAGTLSDFQTLAPNSLLLKQDLNDFKSSLGNWSGSNIVFAASLGIQLRDPSSERFLKNLKWRVGFSYNAGTALTSGLSYFKRTVYDTLTSSETGNETYVYDTDSRGYNMRYSAEHLRLENALYYGFNPSDRWALFVGLGFNIGLSYNNVVEINYSESHYNDGPKSNTDNSSSGLYSSERFNQKSKLNGSAFLPLGIDFRIGKKNEFWKRMHLYYEFRPAVQFLSIHALGNYAYTVLQQGIGIRIELN